jgi:hypothetical protein
MAREKIERPHFELCVQKALVEIQRDYADAKSGISEPEYQALIADHQAMLNGEHEVFHYRAKLLTQVEHYLLIQKMSRGLLYQHQKNMQCDMVALAIQLKRDAEIRQLGALAILNQIMQK